MVISHYLMFNRDCAEALDVYAAAFGGTVAENQTYGDMPPNPAFPVAGQVRHQLDVYRYAVKII